MQQSSRAIPRVGDSCPTGTYKSGDYCKPFKSTIDRGDTIGFALI
jgi:hypothetical protein